jgi:hypothetical protein
MVRDTSINDFADRARSAQYPAIRKLMGEPQLAQNYTVTSDTFASVSLVRYLDRFAFDAAVRRQRRSAPRSAGFRKRDRHRTGARSRRSNLIWIARTSA